MSVIVKDMNMPTGCGSCDFANYFSDGDPYCRRMMRRIVRPTARLDDCPLEDAEIGICAKCGEPIMKWQSYIVEPLDIGSADMYHSGCI